jgi:hypothetical protein
MSCEKGCSSTNANQESLARQQTAQGTPLYANSLFGNNGEDPFRTGSTMLPHSLSQEMIKFGNVAGANSSSPPQGLVDTSGDEPICFVRVDKDYFLQLLKNNNNTT